MIEYTILVEKVELEQGRIEFKVIPQNETDAEPISKRLVMPIERFEALILLPEEEILVELRNEIIQMNHFFQKVWTHQITVKNATVPGTLMTDFVDYVYPVVTQTEVDAVLAPPTPPEDPEIII